MALSQESLGSVLEARQLYPEALAHYRKRLEWSVTSDAKAYGALQCSQVLGDLGKANEAGSLLDLAKAAGNKFPQLHLKELDVRAELALIQRRDAEAASLAREGLAIDSGHDPLTLARFKRRLGLALIGLGSKKEALRLCREAAAAANSEEVSAQLGLRVELMQALLASGDRAEAVQIFEDVEPRLANLPETRWRALALAARVDAKYISLSREALENLRKLWGDEALRSYLSRPDLQPLSHPARAGPGNHPL